MIIIAVALLSVIVLSGYLLFGPRRVTSFEDADGYVYRCSKPVWVRPVRVEGLQRMQPLPSDELYIACKTIGIEQKSATFYPLADTLQK